MFEWVEKLYFPKKQKKQNKYVYLDKEKRWIFCYKKCAIIEHKDCDFYEHNCECDKNNDFWGRTHSDGSLSGRRYVGDSTSILNECKYCLEERKTVEKYRLSDNALEWLSFCKNREDFDE